MSSFKLIENSKMMIVKDVLRKSLLSIGIILISGCEGSGESAAAETLLELSVTEIEIPYTGGVQTVSVEAGSEWTAYSDADWILCNINGSAEKNGTIDIVVDENKDFEARTADVTVKSGTTRKGISIVQEAAPELDSSDITVPEGYRLVWQDEFNDSNLDSPDESLWYYETGDNGWGNNEIQNYIAGTKNGVTCAEVSNGIFSIIAQKVGEEVYSIRINSKESWKYGYFEARLKLPKGKGTWPAFWMLPKEFKAWPDDGEIDIMEEVGYNPEYVSSSIHTKAYNHSIGTQKTKEVLIEGSQSDFHVYALEWTENYIRTFVDGKELFYYPNDKKGNKDTWPFNAPFYLKLNLAWGGFWGGAQGVDESCLPATYQIDYVRVFQKNN